MIDVSITFTMINMLLTIAGSGLLLTYHHRLRHERQELGRVKQALTEAMERDRSERARARIAQEIHDELGRELTKINMLVTEVQRTRTERSHQLERVASLSCEAHSKLNDIIWAVDADQDTVLDLVEHASRCTDRILQRSAVRAETLFVHNGLDRPIDPEIKRKIFLLLKEAVINSIEHANAGWMQVLLQTELDRFRILVHDDGIGFDPGSAMATGNGLRMMKTRSEELGAAFRLVTDLGKGCSIEVSGPLH